MKKLIGPQFPPDGWVWGPAIVIYRPKKKMNLYKFVNQHTGESETITAKSLEEAESLVILTGFVVLFSISKI